MIRAAEQIPTKRNGNAFLEAEERVCALERAFASGISFCSGVSAGAAVPVSVCAASACDPADIVIAGGVSKAGEVLLDYIKGPFKEMAFFADKDTEFALAELANDAGICGAAKLVLK